MINIVQVIVKFAYLIAASDRYNAVKSFVGEVLEDQNSLKKRYFDYFMIFLVLTTVFILIYEIKHELPLFIDYYEMFAIGVFIVEWLGRLWVSSDIHLEIIEGYEKAQISGSKFKFNKTLGRVLKKKIDFIVSPMSIVDLLAILPSYRPLRILRILLLFRLFKIFRYTQSVNFFVRIFVEKRFEFGTLLILFTFVVFFSSTVIYIYEGVGNNENIQSFFDAIYWSIVTVTTVGYGDVTPVSGEGRFITLLLILGGLGIIAFSTSIITTALTEKMEAIKENRVKAEASKLKDFTIICGYSKMGKVLAGELEKIKEKFIIIDANENEVAKAKEKNYLAIRGDVTDVEILKELSADTRAKSVIALTHSDAVNLSVILSAKSLNENIRVIARANEKSSKQKFQIAGANQVIFPYEMTGLVAAEYVGQPVAFDAIDSILLERSEPVIDEVEVLENSYINDKLIFELGMKNYRLKLIGVIRNEEGRQFFFNPKKDTFRLKRGDIMILIGNSSDIAGFRVKMLKSIKNG